MAITVAQSRGTNANSATSISLAFSSNITSGNRIIVMSNISSTARTPVSGDCTGSANVGSFTLRAVVDVSGGGMSAGDHMYLAIWDAAATGTGACTITIANMPSAAFSLIAITEAHGSVGSVIYDSQNDTDSDNTTGTPNALVALTPSAYDAILVGGVGIYTGSTTTVTPTSGQSFVQIYEDQAGSTDAVGNFIYKIISAGSQAMTWSAPTNKPFACAEAVYIESVGGVTLTPGAGSEVLHGLAPGLGFTINMPDQA